MSLVALCAKPPALTGRQRKVSSTHAIVCGRLSWSANVGAAKRKEKNEPRLQSEKRRQKRTPAPPNDRIQLLLHPPPRLRIPRRRHNAHADRARCRIGPRAEHAPGEVRRLVVRELELGLPLEEVFPERGREVWRAGHVHLGAHGGEVGFEEGELFGVA